jgi:signal transduction histidine kinase
MSIQQQLTLHYAVVVLLAIMLLAGLAHHEFVTEKRLRVALDPRVQAEVERSEMMQVVVCASIPIMLVAGWWWIRRSLQPLSNLARQVEQIQIDTLREALPRTGNSDEIDRLTEAFNSMAARLDQSFQQVCWFALHASHELKTPLTVMRGELESAVQHAQSYTPKQRDCMHSLLDEIQRLTKIVDGLSLLTKADTGQLALKREPVSLAELIHESYEDALILAEPHQVQVKLVDCDDLTVKGDRHRLRQLFLNLTDNAVKYNHPGGVVTMALRGVKSLAQVEISNSGAGIPRALLAHIFDRFVRGDTAREKAAEGCGLGLSIAHWITQAHGGTIQVSSDVGQMTVVTVRLPLAR